MSIVPQVGLEPTRLTTYVPKTYVSTIPPSGYISHQTGILLPAPRNCI